MAELHRFTVQEAVNTDTAGKWSVQSAVTTSGTSTNHIDCSQFHNVIIDCSSTIDILFDESATTNCSDTNDLKLPAGVHSMKIPHGIGRTIYLHWRRDGATNATVRLILS